MIFVIISPRKNFELNFSPLVRKLEEEKKGFAKKCKNGIKAYFLDKAGEIASKLISRQNSVIFLSILVFSLKLLYIYNFSTLKKSK